MERVIDADTAYKKMFRVRKLELQDPERKAEYFGFVDAFQGYPRDLEERLNIPYNNGYDLGKKTRRKYS